MVIFEDRDIVRWIPGKWETLKVSRRTWRRWMDGTARIPHAVVLLAQILVNGELGAIDGAWAGWRIVRGRLWDEADQWHSPATVYAWHWTRQEIDTLKRGRDRQAVREALAVRLDRGTPDREPLQPSARAAGGQGSNSRSL